MAQTHHQLRKDYFDDTKISGSGGACSMATRSAWPPRLCEVLASGSSSFSAASPVESVA